jgi:hypothetical protein
MANEIKTLRNVTNSLTRSMEAMRQVIVNIAGPDAAAVLLPPVYHPLSLQQRGPNDSVVDESLQGSSEDAIAHSLSTAIASIGTPGEMATKESSGASIQDARIAGRHQKTSEDPAGGQSGMDIDAQVLGGVNNSEREVIGMGDSERSRDRNRSAQVKWSGSGAGLQGQKIQNEKWTGRSQLRMTMLRFRVWNLACPEC